MSALNGPSLLLKANGWLSLVRILINILECQRELLKPLQSSCLVISLLIKRIETLGIRLTSLVNSTSLLLLWELLPLMANTHSLSESKRWLEPPLNGRCKNGLISKVITRKRLSLTWLLKKVHGNYQMEHGSKQEKLQVMLNGVPSNSIITSQKLQLCSLRSLLNRRIIHIQQDRTTLLTNNSE